MTSASTGAHQTPPGPHRIVLVRHGETEWARDGKHTGRTDVPLTEHGERQGRAAGDALAALDLSDPLVLASPRARAVHTAEAAGLAPSRTWEALAEWDYGDFEGLTTEQIRERVPDWTVWTHPSPGGEQAEQVHARCDLVLSVARAQLRSRDVVLFGHGHFSRALMARWIELPVVEGRRFALDPGSYAVLGYEHGTSQLVAENRGVQVP
ncbi:acid phosphatase [Rhodococcus sp. HNM0569]|uniref:acid phosphatase n=1 Tax=Rhodococcus sp. HNM0569 TaxID=2716340 RepID=UPI00146C8B5C|nr:acid phosphatase [Rhodococcus sp. HNM0569]NLU81940.1 acid phosphatase [Rhodococcus sp. HNM0569]